MTWETVPLGEVATLIGGGTPSKARAEFWGPGVPWITSADIADSGEVNARASITQAGIESNAGQVVPAGSVLLVTRTGVGKVALTHEPTAFSQDIVAFADHSRVGARYLRHFLQASTRHFAQRARGATILGVTRDDVLRLSIPLPPFPEQRRIAAILDEADALWRTAIDCSTNRARLTRTVMRESLKSVRDTVPLGDLITDSQNGLYKPASDYGHGAPIIRIDSFDGTTPALRGELKRVSATSTELKRFAVSNGDILVNRVNALSHLGKSTIVSDVHEPTLFESNMMRLRVDASKSVPRYLAAWLRTDDAKRQIRRRAKQAINQASVNQSDIAALRVPLIPIEHQQAIANRLTSLEVEAAISDTRAQTLRSLFASLQHRAFRGEL